MKVLFYSILASALISLSSCNLFFGEKYLEPATYDCPPEQSHILDKTITGFKNISDIDSDIMLQLSRININAVNNHQDDVSVYLHPIDEFGNFINGLDDDGYWCEVVDSSFGIENIITTYDLELVNLNEPLSIAIIMDHSGSMGESRVKTLQEEVYNFMENQISPIDEVFLVKYDHKVESIQYPGQINLGTFKNGFVNGFSYFGGGTAIYDAVGKGIELLSNSKNRNKLVIALTDGLENSSTKHTNARELVDLAKANNISLATIGFGDNIDKVMLADTIALGSGGIYHQICRTDEFKVVFNDIYKRYKNFYLLKYRTNRSIGSHKITVKLCNKNKSYLSANNYSIPFNTDSLIVINNLFFEYNSDIIKGKESKKAIDLIDMIMTSYEGMEIEIYGHTDSTGSADFNLDLSERRAKAVLVELKNRGHSIRNMSYSGFGESIPVADNGTPEGRKLNRRVEFRIKKYNQIAAKQTEPIYKTPYETVISVK